MIQYHAFLEQIRATRLAALCQTTPALAEGLCTRRYGDLPGWYQALAALPALQPSSVDLTQGVTIGRADDAGPAARAQLDAALRQLIPWRKGPYSVFGIDIDTEWRSDWKWQRLVDHIQPLHNRQVLDVGCGNGYHCWRMLGAGASRVVGIDPSPRFVVQFYMLKRYLQQAAADVLPLGIEQLPNKMEAFDTTFSMGVLYHRRSPMDHLRELQDTLVPGGELVLETLVIDGGLGQVLVPEGRYAMMNNVWFIPSCLTLESWMRKCGYRNVRLVHQGITSTDEQRSTEWMRFHSLPEFLDPHNPSLTREGHPAPHRAVFVAEKA